MNKKKYMRNIHSKKYIALVLSLGHQSIFIIDADNIEAAIEAFCLEAIREAKKNEDGDWIYEKEPVKSVKEVIIRWLADKLSFELQSFKFSLDRAVTKAFMGIDWEGLYQNWDDLYRNWENFALNPLNKIGNYYEYFDRKEEYFALFPEPALFKDIVAKCLG